MLTFVVLLLVDVRCCLLRCVRCVVCMVCLLCWRVLFVDRWLLSVVGCLVAVSR